MSAAFRAGVSPVGPRSLSEGGSQKWAQSETSLPPCQGVLLLHGGFCSLTAA